MTQVAEKAIGVIGARFGGRATGSLFTRNVFGLMELATNGAHYKWPYYRLVYDISSPNMRSSLQNISVRDVLGILKHLEFMGDSMTQDLIVVVFGDLNPKVKVNLSTFVYDSALLVVSSFFEDLFSGDRTTTLVFIPTSPQLSQLFGLP